MQESTVKERWLGATCYLSILVFVPIVVKSKSAFLARHCRQGFALFFTEVVFWLFLAAIEVSVGRIPVLGLLVSIIFHLAGFLVFLVVSVIGFVKALSGESWRLPFLDEFADKVPIR